MLAVVGVGLVIAYVMAVRSGPPPERQQTGGQEISASENAALWATANSALARFIGAGLRGGAESIAGLGALGKRDDVLRILSDFRQAIMRLQEVAPPDEQAPMHRALLPIYREMYDRMDRVLSAASSGDQLRSELEWHRLALLVEEAGAVTNMLSLDKTWVAVANTGGQGVYLRRTPYMEDKIAAWPDGTKLQVIGPDIDSEGRRWKQVRDPRNQVGWVPTEYVIEINAP